jgi:membrane-associated protease RseP (regulator of RpoE activity)
MYKQALSILLISALSGIGVASADQGSPKSGSGAPDRRDDVHVTVTAGRGRLGITAIQISPELRAHFGAPGDRGVLVNSVQPDTPAIRAGLRVGDVVTDVAGTPTKSALDVLNALADRKRGDEVTIAAVRNGQRVELRAKLDSDPGASWQSEHLRGFGQLPDGMDRWFPEGNQELRDEIRQLQQRMEQLEQRFARPSTGDSQGNNKST